MPLQFLCTFAVPSLYRGVCLERKSSRWQIYGERLPSIGMFDPKVTHSRLQERDMLFWTKECFYRLPPYETAWSQRRNGWRLEVIVRVFEVVLTTDGLIDIRYRGMRYVYEECCRTRAY